jgi:ABC-type multidrug transport system permease subunit
MFEHPLLQLALARLREFIRQPEAVFWVYGFPLLMTVALGIAFRNRAPENIKIAVVESPSADVAWNTLAGAAGVDAVRLDQEAARRQLRSGKVDLLVEARGPRDFHFVLDETRPGSQNARASVDDLLQRGAGRKDIAEISNESYTEPGGRYIDFLVPGLLGMGLMGGGLWGVGFSIVELRIGKLLKRYMATPLKRSHFLSSLMLSRLVFIIPEVLVILLFSRLVFGVPCYGSYFSVICIVVLGSMQFAGIGLLIASRAKTLESISGLLNLVMLPMWLASGIFFSIERFPDAIQPVLRVLPLTPVIEALRNVMLDGQSLVAQSSQLAIMLAWGTVSFFAALWLFRWQD